MSTTYHHGNLREALLERAIQMIDEHGVEGLSLRKLAKSLGVSHTAPLRHFKSRGDLLSAIVKLAYQELTLEVLSHGAKGNDPVTRVNFMVRGGMIWVARNTAKFTAMANPDISRHGDDELRGLLQEFLKIAETALGEAEKAGLVLRSDKNAFMWAVLGACMGVCHLGTDGLTSEIMSAAYGKFDDQIAAIANQIVPLPSSPDD